MKREKNGKRSREEKNTQNRNILSFLRIVIKKNIQHKHDRIQQLQEKAEHDKNYKKANEMEEIFFIILTFCVSSPSALTWCKCVCMRCWSIKSYKMLIASGKNSRMSRLHYFRNAFLNARVCKSYPRQTLFSSLCLSLLVAIAKKKHQTKHQRKHKKKIFSACEPDVNQKYLLYSYSLYLFMFFFCFSLSIAHIEIEANGEEQKKS